ncbi:unnamed protein product [Medioppia subpectinata]|uniref:COMM domain-containing protein n=1 Tax=Medioppia subpectinata TaxID=1979941 RepID=A0A7R9Q8Q5_9ACAR|nr:unnamed protein product [Medioppia subpectinata]CAG2116729.1 unnamed protein product [Medioppia subpectinata]
MASIASDTHFNDLSDDNMFSFIHEIIDEMCGICPLKTSKYVPTIWSVETQFTHFVDYMKTLLSQLIDIRAKHESLREMPENTQKVVLECIEVRRPELRKAIINETIGHNNPVLKDFFWKLNVVLDSDKMCELNEPLVNLDLNINEDTNGTKNETIVSMELNREELMKVIDTLEEGQQALRQSY